MIGERTAMLGRTAYLLGTRPSPQLIDAMRAGSHPRPEFLVFQERNGNALVTHDDVARSRLPAVRLLRRRGQSHVGLAALALAQRSCFDALVTTGDDVGLPLALLARVRGARVPIHVIVHGSYFASRKFALLMKLLRSMPTVHYLCLSESLRQTMIGRFGVPAAQVHNTSYGVDTRFFRPVGAAGETVAAGEAAPVVASAGTASRDYRTLVDAAAPLPVDVRIAADSAWFPTSVDIAGDDLPANVEARSYGNYPALRDLYARSLFVVVPLYPARHACGYAVIAEAMAMGKAVITTRTEAASDFVVDGETGYYVRPGDAADLRAKMSRLLEQPALARRLGEQARERIERQFSVEAYCERMERVIARDY